VHSPLLKVYLLGQFRLERFTGHEWQRVTNPLWQHRSVRMLLAYLLSSPGRRRGREQVIEELWPDLDVENATNRLNTSVHQIRKNLNYFSLEPELARPAASRLLRLEADVLILGDASDIWVDVDTFSELIARAQLGRDSHPQPLGRDQSGPYELAEELLEKAVALYGGDFLQGERHFEWVLARREVHQRNWISLLLELADRRMAHENFSGAIDARRATCSWTFTRRISTHRAPARRVPARGTSTFLTAQGRYWHRQDTAGRGIEPRSQ